MNERVKEYLRLGRIFSAEILALIFVLSYLLSASLYDVQIDMRIVFALFIAGIFAHISGAYNNDRLDLVIDKKAKYAFHKPLVSGSILLKNAKIIESIAFLIFIGSILYASYISKSTHSTIISPRIVSTIIFILCAASLAYLYNRFNKSNMFINVVGQLYASFAVLIGMSIIVDFDFIVFLSAIVIGVNGVYLNIIEADFKDFEGDIVNVPKSLGVRFRGEKAVNTLKFYILNEVLKIFIFLLIFTILILEKASTYFIVVACGLFVMNYLVRLLMFKNLSPNREKMKRYIAVQELTSVFLISTIYMIINPFLPLLIFVFVALWLSTWNKALWGTYFRPQV
ncbi:MAG: UbiA family prenyltransferase [Thermoplasmatales archaeon]|nr:MAG: UbiA family prenyltransferase [Thermoplasmatales archaeon]